MKMNDVEMYNDLVTYQKILKKQADEFAEQIWNCEWNTIEELHEMSCKLDNMISSIKLCENEINKVIELFGGSVDGE